MNWKKHVIAADSSIKEALAQLDKLAEDALLFVVNNEGELIGSITDGDVRRGLIKGVSLDAAVLEVAQKNPKFIRKNETDIQKLIDFRNKKLKVIPILNDQNNQIVDVINFRLKRSLLPIDTVIMAGGKGMRLRPLTDKVPKPLLVVGEKPIIEHTIDRLAYYGIENIWISVNYLSEQLEDFVRDKPKDLEIEFVKESFPMGTIGSVSLIENFKNDYVLICNSDLLTNLDYEVFFMDFLDFNADLSVVSIPYNVEVPYAVLEVENGILADFKEKPTYTYFSNGGIYLMKREILDFIPKNTDFSATDLMNKLIEKGLKVRAYPHHGYWLDIGKHDDFQRAQQDVKLFNF
jgi:dTDP-glucose pyrophosphorylase